MCNMFMFNHNVLIFAINCIYSSFKQTVLDLCQDHSKKKAQSATTITQKLLWHRISSIRKSKSKARKTGTVPFHPISATNWSNFSLISYFRHAFQLQCLISACTIWLRTPEKSKWMCMKWLIRDVSIIIYWRRKSLK